MEKIRDQLLRNNHQLEEHERDLLRHITATNVFSNIPHLGKLTKLTDACQRITEIQSDDSQHRPMKYILRSIQSFLPSSPEEKGNFYSVQNEFMDQLHANLYQLQLARKSLKAPIDSRMQKVLREQLYQEYIEILQQINNIQEVYRVTMNRFRRLIPKIRSGTLRPGTSNEDGNDHPIESLLDITSKVNDRLNALKMKVQLINKLNANGINYYDVKAWTRSDDDDSVEKIEQKLIERSPNISFFCFDDKLGKEHSCESDNFYQHLINHNKGRSAVKYAYADFTYCKCCLQEVKILGSEDIPKPPLVNYVNVLLLGESGVGKSTFVNALANYWFFDTLEKAASEEPVALMPVSFLMTMGDKFEEKMITFGDQDPNENHNAFGQSVTQHCRSYVFTIDDHTKMRLIDTPGMGDTRGLDQDDHNMKHILSFISNLPHLNAICILLKPNESRLNVVFRSYFTELVGFLGENIRNNIVFCFTNTRSTFYAPGNTGPLLKKMLQSHSIKDIPFGKTNTFCLDSESFRYLVARMNGIEFGENDKKEYGNSWTTSVKESSRLREYVCNKLTPYAQEKWQSIEHALFLITQLTRPALETLRNLVRNSISRKEDSIQLLPKGLSVPSTICFACQFTTQCIGQFLVVPDELHTFTDKCKNCNCNRLDHMDIEYELKYGRAGASGEENMKSNLEELKEMLLKLACFLANTTRTSEQDDPILRMLNRMITQEKQHCASNEDQYLNPQLLEQLEQFRDSYQQQREILNSNNQSIDLPTVYQTIGSISMIDLIKQQRDASEKCRQEYIEQQEKELTVNIRSTEN